MLHPVFIDGTINEETGKKKESSKLTYKQRFLQEINLNTNGVYLNLVPGDASIEHAVKMHFDMFGDKPSSFVTESDYNSDNFLDIFKNYFICCLSS
jgi:hypothetical protein